MISASRHFLLNSSFVINLYASRKGLESKQGYWKRFIDSCIKHLKDGIYLDTLRSVTTRCIKYSVPDFHRQPDTRLDFTMFLHLDPLYCHTRFMIEYFS